jgi:hypothetical protein
LKIRVNSDIRVDQRSIKSFGNRRLEMKSRVRRTTMPDPIARKRLKKKMLDRWENEGGALAADATTADTTKLTEDKGKKTSAQLNSSTEGTTVSPTKRRRPTRK